MKNIKVENDDYDDNDNKKRLKELINNKILFNNRLLFNNRVLFNNSNKY